ncbi:MAG: DUF5719 family protein [Marmoricola sp.]
MSSPGAGGRHVGERAAESRRSNRGGRSAWVALAVAVVTAAALVCAGSAGTPITRQQPATRASATGRVLSCPGGLSGARARVGSVGQAPGTLSVGGKPVHGSTSVDITHAAARVQAGAPMTPHSYAVRSATGSDWLAVAPCPEPRSNWWFVGAGGSHVHGGVLQLENPRGGRAVVGIHVLGPHGQVKAPGLQDVQVPSGHSVRLNLAKVAPAVGDLAVHVVASRGLVSASVAEHWAPDFITRPSSEWVPGQPGAGRSLTLAGLTPHADKATLLVANPSATEAVTHLSVVGRSGTFTPTSHGTVNVPPGRVVPVSLDRVLRSGPAAVRVRSQVAVTATVRSVAGTDQDYATASGPVGAHALAGVPRSATGATLQLVSTASPRDKRAPVGDFLVTTYAPDGSEKTRHRLRLKPGGEQTFALKGRPAAVELTSLGRGGVGRQAVASLALRDGNQRAGLLPLAPTTSGTRVPTVHPGF